MTKEIVHIEYAVEMVVIVRFKGEWQYYVSEKEYWVLDQRSWHYSYVRAGYDTRPEDYSGRFHIPVVDENTAEEFFANMKEFKVSFEMLRDLILKHYTNNALEWEIELFPAVHIDFDERELVSAFPEPFPIDEHVPPGWSSQYGDFYNKIPPDLQYWKIDGVDMWDYVIPPE